MDSRWSRFLKKAGKIWQKLSSSEESLPGKTTRGTFWVFAIRIMDRLFKLIRIIILARILSPDDFGIFGIALLVLSIIGSFSQTGQTQALIQKKDDISSYLDTAWTIRVVRSILIAAIVVLLAGPASVFFKEPGAVNIIRVIGILIIMQGFSNIAVIYFHKELKFQKFFKYQFVGTVVDFTVSVIAVYLLRNVWALIIGLMAGAATRLIMSYVIAPYRPKFKFVKSRAKELFSFGKWIFGSGILVFFILQGDDIFVGSILGATMLGFYQMAYRISNTPTTETTLVISQVTFPLYAKLQDDISRLRRAYLRVLQLVTLFSFPLAGIIIVLAPEITTVILGEQWLPIVPAVQVLAIAGLIRSVIATTIPVFRAIGKPSLETRWQIARLATIIVLIYPLTILYGITGTSAVIAISAFVSSIGFCMQGIIETRCKTWQYIRLLLMPLSGTLIISLSLFILRSYIDGTSLSGLLLLLFIGILIFMIMNIIFDRFFNYRIKELLKKGIDSFISG